MLGRLPLLLSLLAGLALASPPQPLAVVTLHEGGLARVDYYAPTRGNVSITIPLLGTPDEALGIIVVNEWGEPLAYGVNETVSAIFVACLECNLVRASYYTHELTLKVGATWIFNLTVPCRLRLVLPENATVTYLSRLPDNVYTSAQRLVLEFIPGQVSVKYVVTYVPPPQPDQPQAQQPSGEQAQPPSRATTQPQAPQQPTQQPWQPLLGPTLLYAFIAVAVALIATVALLTVRKRRGVPRLAELSEEEVAVLEALRRMGGGAFQSELHKALGMPATSLWRRVKKLERLGRVVVEKRAGRNYVKLA